ncbi:hypothetical protein FRC11_006403 [Ceratobasidium sp. 423]|nr:hypothetical protein FRC11_006403 [Ceratobasidium sp. 423]
MHAFTLRVAHHFLQSFAYRSPDTLPGDIPDELRHLQLTQHDVEQLHVRLRHRLVLLRRTAMAAPTETNGDIGGDPDEETAGASNVN